MGFDTTQLWIFWIGFLIYSIYGFYEWGKYFKGCAACNKLPFNGSLFKIIAMSIICGGITTIITIVTFLWTIVDVVRYIFQKKS